MYSELPQSQSFYSKTTPHRDTLDFVTTSRVAIDFRLPFLPHVLPMELANCRASFMEFAISVKADSDFPKPIASARRPPRARGGGPS